MKAFFNIIWQVYEEIQHENTRYICICLNKSLISTRN